MILPYKHLCYLHEEGLLWSFSQSFAQKFYLPPHTHRKQDVVDRQIIVALDWYENIFPSIIEHFDFDLWSLPINQKIEVCYRNVDLKKFESNLLHTLREIPL